jgi:hypothetical protein
MLKDSLANEKVRVAWIDIGKRVVFPGKAIEIPAQPALSRVCQQIRGELLPLYLLNTKFTIEIKLQRFADLAFFYLEPLKAYRDLITKSHIVVIQKKIYLDHANCTLWSSLEKKFREIFVNHHWVFEFLTTVPIQWSTAFTTTNPDGVPNWVCDIFRLSNKILSIKASTSRANFDDR